MASTIIVAAVAVVVALLLSVPVTYKVALDLKAKKDAETVGLAEDKARTIIDEAIKTAETKKREALLEVKEESLRTKNELERETKERRNELQKYEKRVLTKEETVDKKSEAVEKSKKLLCSQVKIGSQVKQIVSGIRKYYTPEEMVGKKVMVLVNLKPAKLAGVMSEGMLLCAEDAEGNLALMTPEKPMPSGAEIC